MRGSAGCSNKPTAVANSNHRQTLTQLKLNLFVCIALTMANNFTAPELFAILCWELRTVVINLRVDQQRDRHIELFQNVKESPSSNSTSNSKVSHRAGRLGAGGKAGIAF